MKKSTRLTIFVGIIIGVSLSCQVSNDLFGPTMVPTFIGPGSVPSDSQSNQIPENSVEVSTITPGVEPEIIGQGVETGSEETSDLSGIGDESSGIVLFDEFSNTNGGWDSANFIEGSTGYYNDAYRIMLNRSRYLLWSTAGQDFEDIRLGVEASLIGGGEDNTFGLICRYQNAKNFYAFVISSDGYFAIRKRFQGGALRVISGSGYRFRDKIILTGQANYLRAECAGNQLRFYVNGALLAEVVDSDLSHGDVGLIAGTFSADTTEILFDDFVANLVE